MPNPEQNKWEEKIELIMPFATRSEKDSVKTLLSQTRQQTERLEKVIKSRLKYCQEQNGLPYCKNCGLEEADLDLLNAPKT